MAAGFDMPHIYTDKMQFPSLYWFILFYLPIRLAAALAWNKERNKYRTMDKHKPPSSHKSTPRPCCWVEVSWYWLTSLDRRISLNMLARL